MLSVRIFCASRSFAEASRASEGTRGKGARSSNLFPFLSRKKHVRVHARAGLQNSRKNSGGKFIVAIEYLPADRYEYSTAVLFYALARFLMPGRVRG